MVGIWVETSFFLFKVVLLKVYLVLCLGSHVGSNYLRPLLGPLSNMLQMLQECSQLELALRVLVNSYGSCLQHVTSNVMDIKLSVQVWLQHVQWCYEYHCLKYFWTNYDIIIALATSQWDWAKYFTFVMCVSQLYNTQELKKYNICLNNLQKTTTSSLNAVAVALLNKVSLLNLVSWEGRSRFTEC